MHLGVEGRGDSLEVAGRADVGLGQPLLLPALVLLLPPWEGGVHEVVHLRVAEALEADLGVLDVHCGHGQRRTWGSDTAACLVEDQKSAFGGFVST